MPTRSKFRADRKALIAFLVLCLMTAGLVSTAAADGQQSPRSRSDEFTLTVLHNNDGESQLVNAGVGIEDFGGVARFATVVKETRRDARRGPDNGAIFVSSGDNFLAGPEFSAGLADGVFYDARALDMLRYDAISLGNHDFDFGPDVLAEFINDYRRPGKPPYLSANADFSAEPALQALADRKVIVPSTVIHEKGERIGIIGAITPQLLFISSPRGVVIDPDVAGAIQTEIDALQARGVDKIVLISHLQNVAEDLDLAPLLSGIDVMVAGGGDEVLANPDDPLVPGDVAFGAYPLVATNADGVDVPVVTTAGDYKYLGELEVQFDENGVVTGWEGGPIRIAGGDQPDAVRSSRPMQRKVVEPVAAYLDNLAANVLAQSAVALEGRRDPGIRTEETNLGNLMADSLLWQATQKAAEFGVPEPDVALQNGGGIRNNTLIPAGPLTELDTFSIAAFSNFVAVAPDIPRDQFRQILERAVSAAPAAAGQFAQVGGFDFVYDTSRTAQTIDGTTGAILTAGDRVTAIVLDDGSIICCDGNNAVVPGAGLTVATIDFLARGGDGYPFFGAPFTPVGVSYQQALAGYLTGPLAGQVTAAAYPEGGEGRIIDATP